MTERRPLPGLAEYPGHDQPCNRCGLCCKTVPCAIARHHGLWREGGCIALKERNGAYDCDVITNSWRYPIAHLSLEQRSKIIGLDEKRCTFRAAFTAEQADELLAKPNPDRPDNSCTVWLFDAGKVTRLQREGNPT